MGGGEEHGRQKAVIKNTHLIVLVLSALIQIPLDFFFILFDFSVFSLNAISIVFAL